MHAWLETIHAHEREIASLKILENEWEDSCVQVVLSMRELSDFRIRIGCNIHPI
jgi:hypothetical protein